MSGPVLVTGASGFVAKSLFSGKSATTRYVAASRRRTDVAGTEWRPCPDLSAAADWAPVLDGVDAVVHLAGRAHVAPGGDPSPYWAENCAGTLKLARDASAAGVRRFIFLSTAKVLGDESGDTPLAENAPVRPGDPYAVSKVAAEKGLAEVGGGMQIVIVRSPLVYGSGVKANFFALLTAVARGVPLPLAAIRNRRSLIGVENLAAALVACLESPAAAGRTYHVTDGAPVSTPGLVRALAAALGCKSRLFPVPVAVLEFCGAIAGRGETVKRLTRSLELDDRAIRTELGWQPAVSFEEGIARTVQWYRSLRAP